MKVNKILSSLFTSMLLFGLVTALPSAYAQEAVIRVEPSFIEFGNAAGDPIPIPTTRFTVTVTVYNVANLYGYDLKFRWNPEYLAYVSHTVLAAWKLPIKDEVYPEGWYWIAYSRMAPDPPVSGNIPIFTMTFEIIKQPYHFQTGDPKAVDPIDTLLDFISTDLADSSVPAKPIPHTTQPATVRIWEQLFRLPPPPTLQVRPAKVENKPLSSTFDIEIWIVNVNSYYDIAGFDITLNFDPTLIEAIAITEGPYLKSYATATFVVLSKIDNTAGAARLAVVQLPPRTMFGAPPSGILFTVTFHVIFEDETFPTKRCDLTIGPSDIALFPHPEIEAPPYNGRPWSVPLEHFKEKGVYVSLLRVIGPKVDLYVSDFPDPFNGKGLYMPCEGYAPQKTVNLKALVTYNDWPVQFKLVSFEIRDPKGRIVAIRTAFTNRDGIASVSYRLPWPCEDYPEMFGIWTVIATVDVYCKVVNDTLQFKLWWPLELLEVQPLESTYKIGGHMAFKVTMRTNLIMSYNAKIVLVVYDDVDQPIAHKIVSLTYGWNDKDKWCEWKEYTITIECIEIPKWAAPGMGKVYVMALRDLPWNGGDALSPEISATFGIRIP